MWFVSFTDLFGTALRPFDWLRAQGPLGPQKSKAAFGAALQKPLNSGIR